MYPLHLGLEWQYAPITQTTIIFQEQAMEIEDIIKGTNKI